MLEISMDLQGLATIRTSQNRAEFQILLSNFSAPALVQIVINLTWTIAVVSQLASLLQLLAGIINHTTTQIMIVLCLKSFEGSPLRPGKKPQILHIVCKTGS